MVRQNSEREEASIAYATPVGLTLAVAGGWLRARGGSHSNGIASSAADCDGFERRGLGVGQILTPLKNLDLFKNLKILRICPTRKNAAAHIGFQGRGFKEDIS